MINRALPFNLGAEESLLGVMLLSWESAVVASNIARPEHFYSEAHALIFEAIVDIARDGGVADPISVADLLQRRDALDLIGGPATLVALQASAPAIHNARRYAEIVEELAVLRKMIQTADEIANLGYSLPDDVGAAVEVAKQMINEL